MSAQICCAFCNTNVSSAEIADHLLQCANKTEQCPNCEKYVRRAVFAYHYENNCAPDPDAYVPTPEIQKPLITVKCKYCQQNCHKSDYKQHQKHCLQNLKLKQQSYEDDDSDHTTNSRRPSNDSDESAGIPCEWCTKLIPFEDYQRHAEACRDEEHRKLLERHREREFTSIPVDRVVTTSAEPKHVVTVSRPLSTDTAKCIYCKNVMSATGITYHQLACVKNPKRNKNQMICSK